MSENNFKRFKNDPEADDSLFGLKDKVAVITGGTKGIGLAIAIGFAKLGVKVVIASRKKDHVQEAIRHIENIGGQAHGVSAHMGRKEEINRLIEETLEHFHTIDILVNNASINPVFGPIIDIPDEAWEKIMSVNVTGYFRCARAAARIMMDKKRGIIINVGSMGGFKARNGTAAYCVSKAAIVMLTKALARELAPYNIRVNCLAPSIVDTQFSSALIENPELSQRELSEIPLGRFANVNDMVGNTLFLASDLSSYVTGQTICIDGGRSA